MENISLKDNLLPNEQILAQGKTHWMRIPVETLLYPILYTLLILVQSTILEPLNTFSHDSLFENWCEDDAGMELGIIAAISLIISSLKYLKEELYITNIRVVRSRGLLHKSRKEIDHSQIESFKITQGVIGCELEYGHLKFRGTGGTKLRVFFVKSPYAFCTSFSDIKYKVKKPV